MFYIFIFESIGTSELMLIGLVALIVFGPRKLPELARTIGKTMAEFRRSTDDFKKTWQQELAFEEEKESVKSLLDLPIEDKSENSISRNSSVNGNKIEEINLPQVRELDKSEFDKNFVKDKTKNLEIKKASDDKRDWL